MKNNGDFLLHTVAIRYRVYGTGNLRTTLLSLQEVSTQTLNPIAMVSATDKFPSTIANFKNQRTQVEFKVTSFGEKFTISSMSAFAKPTTTGYPQV